ncbi:uncharacterized protein F4807DRAFT_423916 [Annulohypoxylon truncatum]|uniref:uncharacterized protein n=1 Tax=Annulohypoxylon truncatum TaxID=327061 RepID=UPI002008266F|nr:uncharacterized protein F4807DRAFT_423916 [Annulohypoxylon truncatum]KAI1210132.1 hypothetical protein F4807DRAFT_423916 [Annulohypoxylon truncatum]
MGNQNSKEVKAESDGEEGTFGSSPFGSRNPSPSPRPSPDIVFSSQVHSSTPKNRHFPSKSTIKSDQYLTTHRRRVSALNSDSPHTSPSISDIKREKPESPEEKKHVSTPTYRPGFKTERKSSDSPNPPLPTHTPSDIKAIQNTEDDMDDFPSFGEPPSSKSRRRRRKRKERHRKQVQQLASPNLGNDQEDPNSSLYSNNGATVDPTPSKNRPSKRRKTATPGSQSRKKKQKYSHDEDNLADNAIPFSSLAESLYANHRKNGNLETSENGLQDNNNNDAEEQQSNESDQESSISHQSASDSNTNNVDLDSASIAHSDAVPSDDIKADPSKDDATSHSGSQPNSSGNLSGDNDSSSEVARSDDQDKMDIDGEGPSKDESEDSDEDNEKVSDGEENESHSIHADPNSKSTSVGADAINDSEYHLDNEEELPDNPQTVDSRPKQNSARKRVVKPTFYERLAEGSSNGTTAHGSSSPVAGPSTSRSTGRKQAKISTMLKGNAEDSPGPKTPSQKRSAPFKTPKSGPHELVTGPFSDFELRNLTQAVERWRDDHNLTQTQVNSLIQGNPKEVRSQEFWARIVAVCPNRPRQKVINQCRRKFHNFVARGTWTEEQQEELKRVWEEHGNKYALIGKIINRHPEDVRDRIRNYAVCGKNRRSDPWSVDEEEKLQAIIADALRVIREHRREGRIKVQEADEELIDWQRVSELMDRTRSRLQCIQKWKIMNRRGAERGSIDGGEVMSLEEIIQKARNEANAMSSRERFNIVNAVDASDAKADSRIPWAKVRSAYLDDRWTRPTIMLAWYRLRHSIPDWSIMTVPEIVTQLSKTYQETRKLEYPSGIDYDVDTEYADMERKVQKMLKVHRTPKTPNIVVKTDDDDSGDEGSSEEDEATEGKLEDNQSDEDEDDDEASQENSGTSKDNKRQEEGSEIDEASNDESKDEDIPMKDETDGNSSASVDLGNNAEESVDRESSAEAPSITKVTPRKIRRSQKRYSSSARSARFQKKAKPTREIIEESSQEEQAPNEDEELSSDTNASSVESIPFHL